MVLNDIKACVVFHKLFVNSIENSSGIFIGTNQAGGWTTYSKSNSGFGNLKDATLSNAIGIVSDPDLFDTTIHDAPNISLAEAAHAAQQCAIEFESVNVNTLMNASAVDIGDIKQLGWRTARKNNYGQGKSYGANRMSQMVNVVFDDDRTDATFHIKQNVVDQSGNTPKNVQIVQKSTSEGENDGP
ncbi:hypothetical protein [Cohnella nanjingensis]|uniref:Uncharacterized protein n=1 Tax=Cohnella nanjingensis TaxID=1387779 RepID=A0A7X0RL32_9BACL|nr:hypothetical protein [Cohnella nanjingensis]MBB6669253.1 hypothetical protein [Cohnella nanjingensis]